MGWIKEFLDTPFKVQSLRTKEILISKTKSDELIRAIKLERKGVFEENGIKIKRVGYGSIN